MQAGFGLLEVGSIRAKNAQNVLLKNILDGCTAALAYWATGFALALGEGGNPFLGKTYFFLVGYEDQLVFILFLRLRRNHSNNRVWCSGRALSFPRIYHLHIRADWIYLSDSQSLALEPRWILLRESY